MSQENILKLQCSKCKHINYWTTKNRKSVEHKIELKKMCNNCRVHTLHKEARRK